MIYNKVDGNIWSTTNHGIKVNTNGNKRDKNRNNKTVKKWVLDFKGRKLQQPLIFGKN